MISRILVSGIVCLLLAVLVIWIFKRQMTIDVYSQSCDVYRVQVSNDATVEDLSRKIADLSGVPISKQRLVSKKRRILVRRRRLLTSYDVESGDAIYLIGPEYALSAKYDSNEFREACKFEETLKPYESNLEELTAQAVDLLNNVTNKEEVCESLAQLRDKIRSTLQDFNEPYKKLWRWLFSRDSTVRVKLGFRDSEISLTIIRCSLLRGKYEKTQWLAMPDQRIQYSEKYNDDTYEYRHVILPSHLAKLVPKTHLLTESEWRNLGVQQSPGWIHYMIHGPEPHILLFRRPRTDVTQH